MGIDVIKRKHQFQDFYMTVAYEAAKLSRATKRHVGAIVVRDGNILAYGYNGTPHGIRNDCEKSGANGSLITRDEVVHGEMNAILKAGDCRGADMYTTYSPCIHCAKHIIQAGIRTVYYHEIQKKYQEDALALLSEAGVTAYHMDDYND
jgi:dCMP deaminase